MAERVGDGGQAVRVIDVDPPTSGGGGETWRTYCLRMASACHDLAEICTSPERIRAHLAFAAQWILMAKGPPFV